MRYHQIALRNNPILAVRETFDAITRVVCIRARLRYQMPNNEVAYSWTRR